MSIFDSVFRSKQPFVITLSGEDETAYLVADALSSANINQGLDITDHPVEKGSNISDHAKIRLINATVSIIITEAPLTIYSGIASIGLGGIAGQTGTVGAVSAGVFTKVIDSAVTGRARLVEAKKKLDDIVNKKQVINILYKDKFVNNLMIDSLNYSDSVANGYSLLADITFKEVRTVESLKQNVIIASRVSGLSKSATKKTSKGLKQTIPTKEEVQDIFKNWQEDTQSGIIPVGLL